MIINLLQLFNIGEVNKHVKCSKLTVTLDVTLYTDGHVQGVSILMCVVLNEWRRFDKHTAMY